MSEQLPSDMQKSGTADVVNEIHPLDFLIVLARNKRLVIALPIITGALALGASLMMTPIFTSTAKIMPPQQQQSSGVAAMLGQLGGLASAAGSIAGLKNPNDLYIGLLESRTISDRLISRFKLKERYEKKTMDDTRAALNAVTDIDNGKKDGLISISAMDKDPKFAADLANAYVDELTKLTQTMAITESSQRRVFFEQQLNNAKERLAEAEVAMRKTQEKTGLIQLDGQVQAIIGGLAQLKGTIAAKEVQLNSMRTFAAEKNPDLLRAQEELRGLRGQLSKLEKSGGSQEGDFMVPTGKLPEAGVEYVRSLRNIKYYETIFELLSKQYELAKIDEAKDSSLIQLLDKAVPAERKSKPKKALITLAGVFFGGMIGIIFSFARAGYQGSRQHPQSSKRWDELSLAWKGSAHEK